MEHSLGHSRVSQMQTCLEFCGRQNQDMVAHRHVNAFVSVCAASPDAMQPVEALLDVAAYPDQAISTISFNFWHRLMRRLVLGDHSTLAQHDGEVIKSHSQDPAINAHSAVSPPPPSLSPPPPPIVYVSASLQPDHRFVSSALLALLMHSPLNTLAAARSFSDLLPDVLLTSEAPVSCWSMQSSRST